MAVSKNLYVDLTTDLLTDWQKHGDGAQTNTTLEPGCSFTLHQELSSDQCWLLEAVVSVNAAPLDPGGARIWASFRKHNPASYSRETYSLQVRLEDEAGTRRLVLYDMTGSPGPVAMATLALDRGWDWTDNGPRIRVRLRLDVNPASDTRTLHLEAEPSDDPRFEKGAASLGVSKALGEAGTAVSPPVGAPLEVGFGNFGTESSHWESVHVSVGDRGTSLPYWPAPVTPAADHDSPAGVVPGYRIFSPGLGEVTMEFDCQDSPGDQYIEGDHLTLSLEVSRGEAPAARAYSSVPAGVDSHTFAPIDDEQSVTGIARVCDVSGRCTQRRAMVVVDNSGPVLTITDVSPDYAMVGTEVAVEFTSNEPLDEDTLQVTLGTRKMRREGLGTTPYRFVYSATNTDPEGPQTVVVQAADPAGNSGECTSVGDVNLDFTNPTIDAAGASVDKAFVADGQRFTLYVDVSDVGSDVDPDAFNVTLDGRPLSYVDRTGFTFEFEYAADATMDRAGPQSIDVRARDLAGNEIEERLADIVTFAFSPPELSLTDKPTSPVGDGVPFSITLTVTNEYSAVDDATFEVTVGGLTMAEGTFSAPSFEFTHTASSSTSLESPQDIVVTVRDAAGNEVTQTFDDAVFFDFSPPMVALEDEPSAPVGDRALVHVTLDITDVHCPIDTGDTFVVTVGGRTMYPGGFSHPSYPFSLTVDRAVDTDGAQDLVVRVRDTAGNETTETFPAAVSYDFVGPVITVEAGPTAPVGHDTPVDIILNVTDDYSQIDIGLTFVATLGGREMDRGLFLHPGYPFRLTADKTQDTSGPQDLVVTVRDAAGNETVQTFGAEVTFDFEGPVVAVESSPSAPMAHHGLVDIDLTIEDAHSDIDTASLMVTLGGREMDRGSWDHPTYCFGLAVDSAGDSAGPQDLVVTVGDTAGNEVVQTFAERVTYDFESPRVTVESSPTAPVGHTGLVDINLTIEDAHSDIDTASLTVTLGGREMDRGSWDHPSYCFGLAVDSVRDVTGPQDLLVTVRDAAGNETVETFAGLVAYDLAERLAPKPAKPPKPARRAKPAPKIPVETPALVNHKITLVCAKGDDEHFHQQYDPELEVISLPDHGAPCTWILDDVVAWNDIVPGTITVSIQAYDDRVWKALPDTDPRKDAIRLAAIVPVEIDVPDGVWLEESNPAKSTNPWFRFTGTVDGTPFSVTVFLRTLSSDVFLVFERQDRAGSVRLSQPSEPGTKVTWSAETLTGIDSKFTVSFDHDAPRSDRVDARIGVGHPAADWPALGAGGEVLDPDDLADATFDLRLSQPGHADSYLPCELRLRKLIGDRHLVFTGQVFREDHPGIGWSERAVIAGPGETYSGRVVDTAGAELSPQPLALNEWLGLAAMPTTAPPTGADNPPWNEDQSFNLRIQAAETTVVPASFFDGRGLHFRELSPQVLNITKRPVQRGVATRIRPYVAPITVAGNAETWVFGDLDTFDLTSDLNAAVSTVAVVTPTLKITWKGGNLRRPETGELAMVLLRADSPSLPLSPPVRVSLPVIITRIKK